MLYEPTSDLDIERQLFRECAGAAEALARAFRAADAALPSLSPDARGLVRVQLRGLSRRTCLLIARVGFSSSLNNEREQHELDSDQIEATSRGDSGGGSSAGDGSASVWGGTAAGDREDGGRGLPGLLAQTGASGYDDGPTPRLRGVSRLKPSKYFHPDEFRCRDGSPYPEAFEIRWTILSTDLDTIREAYGHPLIVVSGYRSPAHNAAIKGAGQSQHVEGRAADLRPFKKNLSVGDINRLHDVINTLLDQGKLPAVAGVGVYPLTRDRQTKLLFPGFVHVDVRPRPADGHIARWTGDDFGAEVVT